MSVLLNSILLNPHTTYIHNSSPGCTILQRQNSHNNLDQVFQKHADHQLTYVKGPEVSKTATTHAAIYNQARFLWSLFCVDHSCVALSWWWQHTICNGNIPANHIWAWTQLQSIQVIQVPKYEVHEGELTTQFANLHNKNAFFHIETLLEYLFPYIPGNIIFGVFTVICKSSKQIALVSNKRKTVTQSRARRWPILGCFWFESLPLPSTCLVDEKCYHIKIS